MPRKSLAEVLYDEAEDTPEVEGEEWLLLYDFEGIKPGTKFYTNLARLSALKDRTELIQYSALLTSSRRVALAARSLAAHYRAKTTMFKVVETDI
jgi:hypothetical protein